METCMNCGKQIGNLETAHVFKGSIVCLPCDAKLNAAVAPFQPSFRRPARVSTLRIALRWISGVLAVACFLVGWLNAPKNVDSVLLSRLLFGAMYAALPTIWFLLLHVKRIV